MFKLAKLANKESPPSRRLKIFIGVFLILLTYYVTTSTQLLETASAPSVKQQVAQVKQNNAVNSTPVMPKGYQDEKVTRNPFALPPDMLAKTPANTPPSSSVNKNISSDKQSIDQVPLKSKEASPNLRLTGIITSQDTRLAVINTAGKSKSYRVNDSLGSYKVADISGDTVLLNGPDGTKVLNLDTAHKGEANNAK